MNETSPNKKINYSRVKHSNAEMSQSNCQSYSTTLIQLIRLFTLTDNFSIDNTIHAQKTSAR